MPELGLEDDGLDGVEAAVDALDLVDVFLERAMVGEQAGLAGEVIVVRDDGPAVPVGAEVLAGIEAERPGDPEGPGLPALVGGEVGLGAVLDQVELVPVADGLDGLDVHGLAVDVDGDDGLGPGGDLGLDELGVDVVVLVVVDEHGPGPRLGDRLRGGHEAVGDGDDLVARADAQGFQGDVDGIRAVGAADAVLAAVLLGVGLLESLDVLAADEGGLADDGLDGGVDLGLDGLVLGLEVDEGDVHGLSGLLNGLMR